MKRRVVLILLFLILVLVSCAEKMNYATDKPFIVVTYSPAGPDEYRNLFPRHYSVYEDGRLTLSTSPKKGLNIGEDAPVYEKHLKTEEIENLKSLIEENHFWRFREDLTSPSEDGAFVYVTVNLTNQSKKVGGLNPTNKKFNEISDYVFDLASGEGLKRWNKEITNYIYKMNP